MDRPIRFVQVSAGMLVVHDEDKERVERELDEVLKKQGLPTVSEIRAHFAAKNPAPPMDFLMGKILRGQPMRRVVVFDPANMSLNIGRE